MKLISQYIDYFEELRYRLLWSIFAWICCFLSAFCASDMVNVALLHWLRQYQHTLTLLVVLSVWDWLLVFINLTSYIAFFTFVPCLFFHLYKFVAPALYRYEKSLLGTWLCCCAVFFYFGAYMAWWYGLPGMMYMLPLCLPFDALWLLTIQGYVRIEGALFGYGDLNNAIPLCVFYEFFAIGVGGMQMMFLTTVLEEQKNYG